MFPEIQRYLKGWDANITLMIQELSQVPKTCMYSGVMYRGMRCNPRKITPAVYASWTTSYDVAKMFAGDYGVVICKNGKGVDVIKLKSLYHWSAGNKYEREIISSIGQDYEVL